MNNPNWIRWINASFTNHFQNFITTQNSLPSFLIGHDVNKDTLGASYAEIRLDGPHEQQKAGITWYFESYVNVRVVTMIDDKDFYAQYRNDGIVAASFKNNICVFKYGDGVDDDQSFLGTMQLITRPGKEGIIVTNWGQILTNINAFQTTVEGHYRMYLTSPFGD